MNDGLIRAQQLAFQEVMKFLELNDLGILKLVASLDKSSLYEALEVLPKQRRIGHFDFMNYMEKRKENSQFTWAWEFLKTFIQRIQSLSFLDEML